MVTRRAFLKGSGLTLLGMGIGGVPAFLTRAAGLNNVQPLYGKRKVLVCIFQRGAMDGLMAVTPFTDNHLKTARPDLFVTPAGANGDKALLDLDGRFGLHPAMRAFQPLYRERRLGIVHGMGSPNTTRSHFDAQDYMESGTPFTKSTDSGWLNRAAGMLGHEATPFQAVSLTPAMPRALYGDQPALAISNLKDFTVQTRGNPKGAVAAARSFEELYDQTSSALLNETGKESFEAMRVLQQADSGRYTPGYGAVYPVSPLGNALKQIAQLIKMDVGLEVAFAESGGWDTHFNQGAANGIFARSVADLSNSIAAFWMDLEQHHDNVTVMTMTEFGRTVKQNGTRGTDHGRASCGFILGNNVRGGMVHGTVPELAVENLEDHRDLPVTTDFRSVFGAVAGAHLGIQHPQQLFPGWSGNGIDIMKG